MINQQIKAKRSLIMVQRFYKKYNLTKPSLREILEALRRASCELSKDYWRQYRLAFIFAFENANKISSVDSVRNINYQTCRALSDKSHNSISKAKTKTSPCKKVTEAEHQLIINKMIHDKKPNYPLLAVIDIIHRTGVRPAEVDSMRFDTDNCCILITGAKKTEVSSVNYLGRSTDNYPGRLIPISNYCCSLPFCDGNSHLHNEG